MKIEIDIDCTPEEARAFLGLPDVRPMQDAVLREIQERMVKNLASMDAEGLFRVWMPAGLKGWEEMQKVFWSGMQGGGKVGEEAEG